MNLETISITLRVAVCCVVFAFFVFMSLKSRLRYNAAKTGLLVSLLVLITAAVTVFFLTSNLFFSEYSSWGILLWIISAMLIFQFSIKGSWFEILFIVLVVLNLYVNIVMIAKVLGAAFQLTSPVTGALLVISVLAAHIPLIWILMFRFYKPIVEFNIHLSFWKFLWILPALTYLIFYVKLIQDYWVYKGPMGTGDIVFTVLWSFTTYLLFLIALQMIIQAYKGVTAKEQAKFFTSQLRMQEGKYEKLFGQIEETARLRHDWRHHLLSINGFAESKDFEGLKTYLNDLELIYLRDEEISICENHVVDVILQHYTSLAKKQGIQMNVQTNIPKTIAISDIDLCLIFGNLAENAMEACAAQAGGEKSIVIKANMKGNQLVAMIQNTYTEKVIVSEGVYYSTKHEGAGIGLSSVQNVIEKYGGLMKLNYNGALFSVYVLLDAATEAM